MKKYFSIFFYMFVIAGAGLHAQESNADKEFYAWFDKVIGLENTPVFNGMEYTERHIMINEKHKFFSSSLFKPGTIYYEGQPFHNINMKYNIFEDLVIVRLPKNGGGEETIQLHSGKLQGFEIDGDKFENNPGEQDGSGITGIHEIIIETGNIRLLKDHVRKIFLKRDGSYPYHEFNDPGAAYAIHYKGNYYPVRNRRDLLNVFPKYENTIKDFYKDYRKLQKSDPENFYIGLVKMIDPDKKTEG